MKKRILFWAGVIVGAVSGFALSSRRSIIPEVPNPTDPLLGLVGEAVLVCDAAGGVVYLNAAAAEWFGDDGAAAFHLRYPSGQPVPPGQVPLVRTLRTGKPCAATGYVCTSPDGTERMLEVTTQLQTAGGAVAVFRDITEVSETRNQAAQGDRREEILRRLCRRLSAALSPDDLARSIAESAGALLRDVAEANARLYSYDPTTKQITRLAASPGSRAKLVRSHNAPQAVIFPLDVTQALLWSVYVGRESFTGLLVEVLGEGSAAAHLALPLIAGGEVIGHLSLTSADPEALFAPALRESLTLLTSVAALALAGPSQAAQTETLAAQVAALREIVGAVAKRLEPGDVADLVGLHTRRVLGADVCILALAEAERLCVLGRDYQDALLFPERYTADSVPLTRGESEKAQRTGKTVQTTGRKNPRLEDGLWRAFAGQSGRHSVLSVPLPTGLGVVTVLRAGEAAFSDDQVRFMETLAALTAAALPPATIAAARED